MARAADALLSVVLLENSFQAIEIGGSEDEAVLGRDINEVEVDAGSSHPSSQVGEHARPVVDVDDDHLTLLADRELRKRQRVPGSFGMRHQDVQLDVVRGAETCRRRKIDARVADGGRNARESTRLVLDLDDQIERNRTPPSVADCYALCRLDAARATRRSAR